MLIKNSRMMTNGILKLLRLQVRVRSLPAVALLGGYVLLFCAPLHSQDMLLKEYIYLDGRLLAVERQLVTQTAQQLPSDSDKRTKTELALYPAFEIHNSILLVSSHETLLQSILSTRKMDAFHDPLLARFSYPDNGQSRFAPGETFTLQWNAYRWQWKAAGILRKGNGGDDEGL